jgi:hypothetical protein
MYFAPGEHNPLHFHVYHNQTPRQDLSLALVFDTGTKGTLDMKP